MTYNKEINQMKPGDIVQNFFLIKSVECKTSNNGKKYLDIVLSDRTGELNAKLWECSQEDEETYAKHVLVKIQGSVAEWQSRIQLRIEKIRPVNSSDGVDIGNFVPVAPQPAELMYTTVLQYISKIKNSDMQNIVNHIVSEKKDKLLLYPAAKQNHHAVRSGLLYHISTMLAMGEKVSEIYQGLNHDLLFAGIILHDIAKVDEMDAGDLGIVADYTLEGELLGHIIQGIKLIDRAARDVGADEEVSMLLQHMILTHHYEPEFGSPKRPMIPEGEILHYLDIIDARMFDMQKALSNTQSGNLSDKIWVLHNRKLYKATCSGKTDEGC